LIEPTETLTEFQGDTVSNLLNSDNAPYLGNVSGATTKKPGGSLWASIDSASGPLSRKLNVVIASVLGEAIYPMIDRLSRFWIPLTSGIQRAELRRGSFGTAPRNDISSETLSLF
jgi:hypothetical protein